MKNAKFFARLFLILVALPFVTLVAMAALPFVTVYFIVQLFVPERKHVKVERVLHPSFN